MVAKMKVINLFGGPGCSKSTTAAGLFYLMKKNMYNVELVNEYAKELTWENRHKVLSNEQIYIFSKQLKKLNMIKDQVEWAVTDSPLLLSMLYMPEKYPIGFSDVVKHFWNDFENINYVLTRTKKYVPIGRGQSEAEAIVLDTRIENYLIDHNIPYETIDTSTEDTNQIIYDKIANYQVVSEK